MTVLHNTARRRALREAQPKEERWLEYRVRYLPQQLDRARRRVAALENEARRYGMNDLLGTQPA